MIKRLKESKDEKRKLEQVDATFSLKTDVFKETDRKELTSPAR